MAGEVRCSLCDTLKLTGAEGWVVATDGSGHECCPRCYAQLAAQHPNRPLRVPPLPTDPGGPNTRGNKVAIQRGESWKALHEEGKVPRWPRR